MDSGLDAAHRPGMSAWGGFAFCNDGHPAFAWRSNRLHQSSLRAKRSNPWHIRNEGGLLRCARNDGFGDGWKKLKSVSFRDAPLGAGPESITTNGGYGFRARSCASPRNDGLGCCFAFGMKAAYDPAFSRRGCVRVVHVGSAQ